MHSEFPTRRALLGSFVGPLVVAITWSTHSVLCIGPFVLFSLACWIIVYLRVVEMVRTIRGH
jgi:hypothetical protein